MPIQIGRRPDHTTDQPLGLLSDCHRRIEHFLDVLTAFNRCLEGGVLTPAQREELGAALNVLATAAPKHTADEEQSLFPRLRAAGDPRAAQTLEILDRLQRDHDEAERHHAVVDALCRQWLTAGTLSPLTWMRCADTSRPCGRITMSTSASRIASFFRRRPACSPQINSSRSGARWRPDGIPHPAVCDPRARRPCELVSNPFLQVPRSRFCHESDEKHSTTEGQDAVGSDNHQTGSFGGGPDVLLGPVGFSRRLTQCAGDGQLRTSRRSRRVYAKVVGERSPYRAESRSGIRRRSSVGQSSEHHRGTIRPARL